MPPESVSRFAVPTGGAPPPAAPESFCDLHILPETWDRGSLSMNPWKILSLVVSVPQPNFSLVQALQGKLKRKEWHSLCTAFSLFVHIPGRSSSPYMNIEEIPLLEYE